MLIALGNLSICIVIHPFLLTQEKAPKDITLFQKVKMHVFFLFNADFQYRWNDGGSAAWSAAALDETDFVGESSALVTGAAGDATIVLGNKWWECICCD